MIHVGLPNLSLLTHVPHISLRNPGTNPPKFETSMPLTAFNAQFPLNSFTNFSNASFASSYCPRTQCSIKHWDMFMFLKKGRAKMVVETSWNPIRLKNWFKIHRYTSKHEIGWDIWVVKVARSPTMPKHHCDHHLGHRVDRLPPAPCHSAIWCF